MLLCNARVLTKVYSSWEHKTYSHAKILNLVCVVFSPHGGFRQRDSAPRTVSNDCELFSRNRSFHRRSRRTPRRVSARGNENERNQDSDRVLERTPRRRSILVELIISNKLESDQLPSATLHANFLRQHLNQQIHQGNPQRQQLPFQYRQQQTREINHHNKQRKLPNEHTRPIRPPSCLNVFTIRLEQSTRKTTPPTSIQPRETRTPTIRAFKAQTWTTSKPQSTRQTF